MKEMNGESKYIEIASEQLDESENSTTKIRKKMLVTRTQGDIFRKEYYNIATRR